MQPVDQPKSNTSAPQRYINRLLSTCGIITWHSRLRASWNRAIRALSQTVGRLLSEQVHSAVFRTVFRFLSLIRSKPLISCNFERNFYLQPDMEILIRARPWGFEPQTF